MSSGYESEINDISYFIEVASITHREQFASLLNIRIERKSEVFHYYNQSGVELSLSQVHQLSQFNTQVQRAVYNLWMSYAR